MAIARDCKSLAFGLRVFESHRPQIFFLPRFSSNNIFWILTLFSFFFSCICHSSEKAIEIDTEKHFPSSYLYIPVIIQGKHIQLLLDTGSKSKVTLHKKHSFDLFDTGRKQDFMDAYGVSRTSREMLIPSLLIGNHQFLHVNCFEDEKWLNKILGESDGLIGRDFFSDYKLVIDSAGGRLIFAKTDAALVELGYSIKEWEKVSFKHTNEGIVLEASVDNSPAHFILDTGANRTIIRKTFLNTKNTDDRIELKHLESFKVFGDTHEDLEIVLFNFAQPDSVDGILGIDFLDNKIICIDFPNKLIQFKLLPFITTKNTTAKYRRFYE